VTSQGKRWAISKIANSTRKNIEGLDIKTHEKILVRLECLQLNPFMEM
jgi:hypothetical protein